MARHELPAANSCGLCCTKIKDLTVALSGKTILDRISLHIHCGEITAVVGPIGAGKTTLLKAILGTVPYQGEISFVDTGNVSTKPRLGYVPQFLETDRGAPVSVLDLFACTRQTRPIWLGTGRAMRRHAEGLLSRVDAERLIDSQLGQLSGGEMQRVLLALALGKQPDILLLDEPVSGVDPAGLSLFYAMLDEIRKSFDLTIIIVSHDVSLISRFADRLVLLDTGILAVGSAGEVLGGEAYTRLFGKGGI